MSYQRQMLELSKQRQQEIKKIHKDIVQNKHTDAKVVKQQSYHNDLRKQEIIKDYVAKNQEKKSLVRMQEDIAQQKIKVMKEKRLQEFKQNYESRIQEEMEKIKKREKDLAAMEKEEGDLIKKLQNTQQMQKSAFSELETAIKYQGSGRSSPKGNSKELATSPGGGFKEATSPKDPAAKAPEEKPKAQPFQLYSLS
eukprot:TRINITY_DN106916_c1_g1_i1.p3 TRINITY_DN106916_c1_g1~~TRINITY_DN106916_c1_g1_i1.p3  ORF type:complete len:196 (+),score=49.99 TRINITY_DN106916_c1_g1_i1:1388-1975(+)